jgi:TRAP-type C4-dicarboxylate transport system substrate-binding protein
MIARRAALTLAIAALAPPRAAAEVVLKLGTLAPQGSAWHEILKTMGQRFEAASDGAVKLRIYAGGVQGNEGDMIRKMGIGQLHAAALSNVGMNDIAQEPKALSIPLFFSSEGEAACAFERVRPAIEDALDRRGFVVLHWTTLGAIHPFCTTPRRTPEDMAGAKLFAQDGDPRAVEGWRAAGFRPVVLSSTDLVPALQTGMVDCVPSLPVYTLTARLHDRARHMMDLGWGYMYGATLVRKDAWERIEPAVRPRLLEIARETGRAADLEVRRLNADALAAMKGQGLVIEHVEPGPWLAAMRKAYPRVRGEVVPAAFFDALAAAREACAADGAP